MTLALTLQLFSPGDSFPELLHYFLVGQDLEERQVPRPCCLGSVQRQRGVAVAHCLEDCYSLGCSAAAAALTVHCLVVEGGSLGHSAGEGGSLGHSAGEGGSLGHSAGERGSVVPAG